jgi:hypothetical protein
MRKLPQLRLATGGIGTATTRTQATDKERALVTHLSIAKVKVTANTRISAQATLVNTRTLSIVRAMDPIRQAAIHHTRHRITPQTSTPPTHSNNRLSFKESLD